MKTETWLRRLIETERGTFECFECGDGPPMVVTHLYSAFDERGNAFAAPFAEFYHVYLINLRGAGNSCGADDEAQYSMEESIKDLEAIRGALRIDKWGFAGHSTGGMLALTYAVTEPASLTKIIAGGTAASYEYCMDPESIYCREHSKFNRIVDIMDQLNHPETDRETKQQLSFEWAKMSFRSEEKLIEAMRRPNSGKTVGPRLDYFRKTDCASYDVRKKLKTVQLPAWIYCGKYDAQCPLKFGEEIANLLPAAQFHIFHESNHNPFFEEEEAFRQFVSGTTQEL